MTAPRWQPEDERRLERLERHTGDLELINPGTASGWLITKLREARTEIERLEKENQSRDTIIGVYLARDIDRGYVPPFDAIDRALAAKGLSSIESLDAARAS